MLTSSIKNYIQVEDCDINGTDSKFIKEYLTPYFKDLYKDLIMRCIFFKVMIYPVRPRRPDSHYRRNTGAV